MGREEGEGVPSAAFVRDGVPLRNGDASVGDEGAFLTRWIPVGLRNTP